MKFIPVAEPVIGEKELEYVVDAVKSGWVSSIGPYIGKFENAFAKYIGVKHAISVGNGTEGLHLALHALGIGPGDEVIVPDFTFVATAHAVLQTGAIPVFVDINPRSLCIDPQIIEDAITPNTKAIIPVHIYGQSTEMQSILEIAHKHNLFIVEDAAEAHGAEYNGQRVGSFGDVGVFSFYGNKVITTGEGGMAVTNDSPLAKRMIFLKDHGMSSERRYFHTELAFNYRMTNLQAALGLAQLEQIETFIQKKQLIYEWYKDGLKDVHNIHLNYELPGTKSIKWFTCLMLDDNITTTREKLIENLMKQGIDWRPFFVPMHQLPHLSKYKRFGKNINDCPVSTQISMCGLNLPSGCNLSESTVSYISECIRNTLMKDN